MSNWYMYIYMHLGSVAGTFGAIFDSDVIVRTPRDAGATQHRSIAAKLVMVHEKVSAKSVLPKISTSY